MYNYQSFPLNNLKLILNQCSLLSELLLATIFECFENGHPVIIAKTKGYFWLVLAISLIFEGLETQNCVSRYMFIEIIY